MIKNRNMWKPTIVLVATMITVISCVQENQKKENLDAFFAQWKVYGIDVSEHQSLIDWTKVSTIFDEHKIYFSFIRATAGKDRVDTQYQNNWNAKKDSNILVGAYHYYRPNENSIEQAENFIQHVSLKKGNLPPVLDIERQSKVQTMAQLKIGLQKWLDKVEEHYGVQPIIYSGSKFYSTFLQEEFADYPLWVANFNPTKVPVNHNWRFWQYSDKGKVAGISVKVDINVFDGEVKELIELCIKENRAATD